jgi:hypothetical protein
MGRHTRPVGELVLRAGRAGRCAEVTTLVIELGGGAGPVGQRRHIAVRVVAGAPAVAVGVKDRLDLGELVDAELRRVAPRVGHPSGEDDLAALALIVALSVRAIVVGKARGPAVAHHPGRAAKRRLVDDRRRGAPRVGDLGQAMKGIVGIGGDATLGVGVGPQVAAGVVGIAPPPLVIGKALQRQAGVGARRLGGLRSFEWIDWPSVRVDGAPGSRRAVADYREKRLRSAATSLASMPLAGVAGNARTNQRGRSDRCAALKRAKANKNREPTCLEGHPGSRRSRTSTRTTGAPNIAHKHPPQPAHHKRCSGRSRGSHRSGGLMVSRLQQR